MTDFVYQELFPLGEDRTLYRKLTADHVSLASFEGGRMVKIDPAALTRLAGEAFHDISHLLRPAHLQQLRQIIDDPEASDNDRFVAFDLLKNAVIAAGRVLPMCQDTGTPIVMAEKGQRVFTGGDDREAISRGVFKTWSETNLRYSQLAPLSMYAEANTQSNLPAQIDIYASEGEEYRFLFIAKGGGSANKSFLFQETPAALRPGALMKSLEGKIKSLGTAACPPYHLAVVIGGTSAELNLKTVKLASCRYLDQLPGEGNAQGRAFRDRSLEEEIKALTRQFGIGAQFGGKYFVHDVRVIRLPRHGASLPIGIGVSCAADRQALGKITADGVFLEELETHPAQYLPEPGETEIGGEVIEIDLRRPMAEIRAQLSRYPVRTRLALSGPMTVARDIAHARLAERLERGETLPAHVKEHMIYYAGPAKTPKGYASGSFGPTTSSRMDSYAELLMKNGGGYVSVGKGNRSPALVAACKAYGGFYLGSVGGPGARLAQDCIRKVELLEYPELGMEAIWGIEVENFPAFIVTDDKGNDFFLGNAR
ncbi:MAG TPA: fumarate hydratase [Alphaproteobacteria bacterium]|nr:fumarate hydratase [Alphaproteobacteria bacterium]